LQGTGGDFRWMTLVLNRIEGLFWESIGSHLNPIHSSEILFTLNMPVEKLRTLDKVGCKDDLHNRIGPDARRDVRVGGRGERRRVDPRLDKKTWSAEIVPINGPDDLRETTRGSDLEIV